VECIDVERATVTRAAVIVFAVFCGACTDGAVTAFEKFYAAAVDNDEAAVRAVLCPSVQASLPVGTSFPMPRVVVRRVVRVEGESAVDVIDASGRTTRFFLQNENGSWCVLGL
jgi:hypothetical protein